MQTIGERLEEARKKKGVSVREAAEATKIRGDYLQKFESNQFDIGLTEIYTRGFLRTYAGFLKLPVDRIMSDYAALGRGEVRPRQPSREVYGRMDITVASAAEAADRAAPPNETSATEPTPAAKPQPHHPRGTGSSLPTGPDPAVVFKWVKIGGIVVGIIVVLVILKMAFTGGSRTPSAKPTASAPAPAAAAPSTAPATPAERTITLVALDSVFIRVTRLVGNDQDGEEIFKGTLNRGQTQVVSFPGPINIWASAGEYVVIDYHGQKIPLKNYFTGYGHAQMGVEKQR